VSEIITTINSCQSNVNSQSSHQTPHTTPVLA